MNKQLMSFAALACLLLVPASTRAAPIPSVLVCSLYGAGFHYVPGTDICQSELTGDTRQATTGGTWRSLLPYPEGKWVATPQAECSPGRTAILGTFSNIDFAANDWGRKQTRAIPVAVNRGEFISKVIMSGGFFDPRTPARHGANSADGLCVRSVDPGVLEDVGSGPENPAFGNGQLPIGCVANSRIVNMPAAYSVSATSAYPSVDAFFRDDSQTAIVGPYAYGTKLVVTTDFGGPSMQQLTYFDANAGTDKPLAGNVSVSVCIQPGTAR